MKNLVFNKKLFLKSFVLFILSSIVWTILSKSTNHFTEKDKGFVTGLGFLIIFSFSIFVGQNLKLLTDFLYLLLLTILTYLIASFGLTLLSLNLTFYLFDDLIEPTLIYSIMNSMFVSIVMTGFIDKKLKIEFKSIIRIVTFFCLIIAYLIIYNYKRFYWGIRSVDEYLVQFNVFQFFLIIPLIVGLNLKKAYS